MWKKPQQYTYYNVIEGEVCLHDPTFKDQKYRKIYRMKYALFQFLVSELDRVLPLIRTLMFVREPIPAIRL